MTILALIVAAIVIQIVLAALVIKTLWIQGDPAAKRATEPVRAQDFGAVAPTPAPSGAVAPKRGAWGRLPRATGPRYV